MKEYTYVMVVEEVVKKTWVHRFCDKCGIELTTTYQENDCVISRTKYDMDGGGIIHTWKIEDLCNVCLEQLCKLLQDSGYRLCKENREF